MMKRFFSVVSVMVVMSSPLLAAAPRTGAVLPVGTWKIVGDVQGVPVNLTCTLVQSETKVDGSCVDDQSKSHPLVAGELKDQTVSWSFNSEYEGTPITVSLAGTLDATGAKMAGTIAVDPMQVDGQFSATFVPAAPPAATE